MHILKVTLCNFISATVDYYHITSGEMQHKNNAESQCNEQLFKLIVEHIYIRKCQIQEAKGLSS